MFTLSEVRTQLFKPFSQYPDTKEFSKPYFGRIILISSILVLIGLAIFNILTQGHVTISTTVVLQTFYGTNAPLHNGSSTTTCQSSLLDVSASYFTRTPTAKNNASPNATVDPGSFKWTINAFNPDGKFDTVQGAYNGEELRCNITSIGFTCYFSGNTYLHGICAKCYIEDPMNVTYGGASHIGILDICSNYNQIYDNWPSFTQRAQNKINILLGSVTNLYSNLTFTPGQLPAEIYPTGEVSNLTITPVLIEFVNFWLGGLSYYDDKSKAGSSPSCQNQTYCATGTYQIWDGRVSDDLRSLFNLTGDNYSSGAVIPVLGIGQLQPPLAFDGNVSLLPRPLPELFDILFSAGGYMFDEALRDLDHRALASSFVCSVQTSQWKSVISIIAVVSGNSLGVASAALTVMITVGSILDQHARPTPSMAPLPKKTTLLQRFKSFLHSFTIRFPGWWRPPFTMSPFQTVQQSGPVVSMPLLPIYSPSSEKQASNTLLHVPSASTSQASQTSPGPSLDLATPIPAPPTPVSSIPPPTSPTTLIISQEPPPIQAIPISITSAHSSATPQKCSNIPDAQKTSSLLPADASPSPPVHPPLA